MGSSSLIKKCFWLRRDKILNALYYFFVWQLCMVAVYGSMVALFLLVCDLNFWSDIIATDNYYQIIPLQIKQYFLGNHHLKIKGNYSVFERGCPLLNTPLFTLKFFIALKSRVARKNQTLAQGVGCGGGKAPFIYGVISVRFNF